MAGWVIGITYNGRLGIMASVIFAFGKMEVGEASANHFSQSINPVYLGPRFYHQF